MKKKILIKVVGCILLTTLLCVGCEKEKQNEQSVENGQTDSDIGENDTAEPEEPGSETDDAANVQEEEREKTIVVYYIDNETGEVAEKSLIVKNEMDIWVGLQETNILNEDCRLNSFIYNPEEKTVDLDFNQATGDRIRSMGTTGETEILGCLINTYLGAYNCEKIKITEEGKTFETAHGADYSSYVGRMDI